jgi:chromatin remodeling complex protein RSC6
MQRVQHINIRRREVNVVQNDLISSSIESILYEGGITRNIDTKTSSSDFGEEEEEVEEQYEQDAEDEEEEVEEEQKKVNNNGKRQKAAKDI